MRFLERFTNKYTFDDGAKLHVLHRYALRLAIGTRSVDVGFEQALESGLDRLIQEGSILKWNDPSGGLISSEDREEIVRRVKEYCAVKGLTYRVVPAIK